MTDPHDPQREAILDAAAALAALRSRLLDHLVDTNDDWLAGKVVGRPDIVEPASPTPA